MASEDKDMPPAIWPVGDSTDKSVLDLGAKPPMEDESSREEIRRMAEIGWLSYAELDDLKIIHPGMRNPAVLNSFRELRTNLYQLAAGKENFVLLVSSIAPEGGASLVSLNLGAVIALDESKTSIVVDCNVYDPALHRILPIDPDYGLVDYLENITLDLKDIIYSTGVRRMRMIPVGSRRQPGTEFFTSSRMRRFLQELRLRYRDRYIVIDAPSIGASADARILAELSDYVVLVVPYGKVTEAQLQASIEAVGEDKLAGVIFNNC
ncbi:MAG TPA: CpsD/CapB family tyrosine-protein kinase [Spongiibacteraceae bacterium]|nr:CpsD/CapB family tyrosine-protein kinase [Spongiibacteraceae bacterium]